MSTIDNNSISNSFHDMCSLANVMKRVMQRLYCFVKKYCWPLVVGAPGPRAYFYQRICWIYHPTQDSSHHQDDMTFLLGNLYKPSFVTVGGGGRPNGYATYISWHVNLNYNDESSEFPFFLTKIQKIVGPVLNMLIFLVIVVVVTLSDPGLPTKYGIPYWQKHRTSSIEPVLSGFFVLHGYPFPSVA